MIKAIVLLAPGFEEIEAVTPLDVLRRASIDVKSVSLSEEPVPSARGVKIIADTTIDKVMEEDLDLIYLPGGLDGTENLFKDERVRKLLTRQINSKKLIAAICAAPTILERYGLSDGKRLTCYPTCSSNIKNALFIDSNIVEDDNILTSKGPGTALEFSLFLIEKLMGPDKRTDISEAMLFKS